MLIKIFVMVIVWVLIVVSTDVAASVAQPGKEGSTSVQGLAAQLLSEKGDAYRKRLGEFVALPAEEHVKVLAVLDARATPLAQVLAAALRCRLESPEVVTTFEAAVQRAHAEAQVDQIGRKMYGAVLSNLPREVLYQRLVAEAVVKGLDPDPRMLRALVYKLPAPYPPVNETVTPEDAVRAVAILAAADKIDDFGEALDRLLRILAEVPEQRCDEAFLQSYRSYREHGLKSESGAKEAILALLHLDTRRGLPIAEAVRAWEQERMGRLPIAPWQDESALENNAELYREQSRLMDTNGGSTNHARLAQIEAELQLTEARWRRKSLWNTIENVVKELREKAAVAPDGLTPTPKK
ncbi:MAG: hypothetical protein IT365_26035 [Candidatus Hydrogenedentes bacterium]|nr:hypothetical protein [Candidatus Hydrogenedentota bacterium]